MNLFRKSLAALLGCALFATTALVADAGMVSQVAVLTFAGAAGVVVTAEESSRVLQAEVIPDRMLADAEAEDIPERVLQEDTPTEAPTGAPTPSTASTDAPTSGGAAMFVGGGASKVAMSCALAAAAGGAMAAVAV